MKHSDILEQKKKDTKNKIIAAFLSLALIASGTGVGVALHKGLGTNKKHEDENEAMDEYLRRDFNINDDAAVLDRAQKIYDISEKEYSVLDIQNAIYILHGKYDMIVYPETVKTDDQKKAYLRTISLLFGNIFDDYILEQPTRNTAVPKAYMLLASKSEGKDLALTLSKLYYKQQENILLNNTDLGNEQDLVSNAMDYYDLYKEFLLKINEGKLTDGEIVGIGHEFSAINIIFTKYLPKDKAADLDGVLAVISNSVNRIFFAATNGLNGTEDYKEALEGNSFGKNFGLGEKYNSADAKDAASKVKDDVTRIPGGKNLGNKTETKNPEKPEEVTKENVEDITSTTMDEVIIGGEVVEEKTETVNPPEDIIIELIPGGDDVGTITYGDSDIVKNSVKTLK